MQYTRKTIEWGWRALRSGRVVRVAPSYHAPWIVDPTKAERAIGGIGPAVGKSPRDYLREREGRRHA